MMLYEMIEDQYQQMESIFDQKAPKCDEYPVVGGNNNDDTIVQEIFDRWLLLSNNTTKAT